MLSSSCFNDMLPSGSVGQSSFWVWSLMQDFAINLENKVSSINEALQMKSLTFVIDACKVLAQARKVPSSSSSSDWDLCSQESWRVNCALLSVCRCWPTPASTATTTGRRRRWTWWSSRRRLWTCTPTPCRSCLVRSTFSVWYTAGTGLTGADWCCCPQRRLCCSALTWPRVSACSNQNISTPDWNWSDASRSACWPSCSTPPR